MHREEKNKHLGSQQERSSFPETSKGKNFLFIIAIDAYQHCPKLYNCVKDANDLIGVLTSQYDFDKENIVTLFNEAATEKNIFNHFRKLAKAITPEDNLLIYFSGHGEYDAVFDEGYWIPVNGQMGAYEDFLPNSKIKTFLRKINSRHTFLVADSCFSGSLFMRFKSAGIAKRLERIPSRWGLTAGRNEVVADGKAGNNSPFADSLLYHLKNNKQPLGVATLCNLVLESVAAGTNQTPRGEPLNIEGHKGGQFFFNPKVAFTEKQETKILDQAPKQEEIDKDKQANPSLKPPISKSDETSLESLKLKPKIAPNGKYGFINRATGEWTIPPKYEKAIAFYEGLAAVQLYGRYGFINKRGLVVIPFISNQPTRFSKGFAGIIIDGQIVKFNREGKIVVGEKLIDIRDYMKNRFGDNAFLKWE